MQIGCGLIRREDITMAKEAGFDYVELMGKHLAVLSEDEFSKIAGELECLDLRCVGINGYCPKEIVISGPGFHAKKAEAYARHLAERASVIGTRFVGIGSPNSRILPLGFPEQLAVEQLKEFLKITAEQFSRYDITVCLEALAPCYCNFINRTDDAIRIVRDIGWESIRVVLDYYNMEFTKEADDNPEKWLEYTAHVHISDDDGNPYLRSFFKEDKISVHKERLEKLYDAGYDGTVTIEVDIAVDRRRAEKTGKTVRDSFKERGWRKLQ